ncbi:uncharacterized protein [Scyliorhinus torazame]|uniref:uncharacterized protein n=1 Tax=Scyliorhinus torazame TaxID=75743 RepID=UPI003B5A84E0
MDTVNTPQPLQVAGNLGVNRKLFKQRFQLFLEANKKESASDTRKIAILLTTAGQHAIHVYNSLVFAEGEDKTKYKTVLLKLDQHFNVDVNECFERYLFQQRLQGKDEPFQSFLTHLRILAQSCGYDTTSDSMIRDQIVFGVTSGTLRQQLLKIKGLTLASAVCVLHENATSRYTQFQAAESTQQGSYAAGLARQAPYEAKRGQAIEFLPACGPDEGGHFARFSRPPALVCAKNYGNTEGRDAQARSTQDRTTHAQWRIERHDDTTPRQLWSCTFKAAMSRKNPTMPPLWQGGPLRCLLSSSSTCQCSPTPTISQGRADHSASLLRIVPRRCPDQ